MASVGTQTDHGPVRKKHMAKDQMVAAAVGNLSALELSLRNAAGVIKADKYGFTAIHLAALHGRLTCLKLLVHGYKGNVNQTSRAGWRPIHLALHSKPGPRALECLQYLIKQGADVNAKTDSRVTALHQAANEGLVDCIVVLTEAGADPHAVDAYGKKPIDLSKLGGHRFCVRYLRHAMWNIDKDLEIREMEKIKVNLTGDGCYVKKKYQREQDLFCQLAFCDWLESKDRAEKLQKASRYQDERNSESTESEGNAYRRTTRRRGDVDRLLSRAAQFQKDFLYRKALAAKEEMRSESESPPHVKTQGNPVGRDRRTAEKVVVEEDVKERMPSKDAQWAVSASAKVSMPQTTDVFRPTDVRPVNQPARYKDHDFEYFVTPAKDSLENSSVKVLSGGFISPKTKPSYEFIKRILLPRPESQRIQMPHEFKATHIFDVKKKRKPAKGQKPESEVGMHLRETLDPSYLNTSKPGKPPCESLCSS